MGYSYGNHIVYSSHVEIPKEFQLPFSISLPFCIVSLVGCILSLVFGCIVASKGVTDEIPPLGLALIFLSGFFFICLSMFATFFISMSRKYKCNRPWFYSFSVALFPVFCAAYYFMLHIGMKKKIHQIFCGLVCFGCFLICAALMGYMYFIANMDLPAQQEATIETRKEAAVETGLYNKINEKARFWNSIAKYSDMNSNTNKSGFNFKEIIK